MGDDPRPRLPTGQRRQRIGLVVGLAGFAVVLAAVPLPFAARAALATVFLMAVFWMTEPLPLWATACFPIVAFPAFGVMPLSQVLVEYVDPVNLLFMGGMMIAASMEESGLHARVALGIVDRLGTSPRRIVLGFMVATAFVSLWISNTAAAVMVFPIGMAVLARFADLQGAEHPDHRRFGRALMLGIGYAASMGGVGSKIGTGTNFVFVKQYATLLGRSVSFVEWLVLGLPVVALAVPLAWMYLTRLAVRLPATEFAGARDVIEDARRKLGPRSPHETVTLIVFLLAAFLWMFRQSIDLGAFRIPGWSDFVPWGWRDVLGRDPATLPRPLPELLGPRGGESVVAVVLALALLVIPGRLRPYRAALSLRGAGGISWGLLVLLGGGFAMAAGLTSSGASAVLAKAAGASSLGHPLLTLVVVCLATTALSEVASNTATASILLPVLAVSAESMGVSPAVLMFGATLASSFGFMLPAGTPPNAVVYSSGYIRPQEMAKAGLVVDVCGAVLVAVVTYLLGPLVLAG